LHILVLFHEYYLQKFGAHKNVVTHAVLMIVILSLFTMNISSTCIVYCVIILFFFLYETDFVSQVDSFIFHICALYISLITKHINFVSSSPFLDFKSD